MRTIHQLFLHGADDQTTFTDAHLQATKKSSKEAVSNERRSKVNQNGDPTHLEVALAHTHANSFEGEGGTSALGSTCSANCSRNASTFLAFLFPNRTRMFIEITTAFVKRRMSVVGVGSLARAINPPWQTI